MQTAIGRRLAAYVGRERELDVLQRALAESGRDLHVIDVVAEPGMGASALDFCASPPSIWPLPNGE
jgi:hypothetical protein